MPEKIVHQFNEMRDGRIIFGDHPDAGMQVAIERQHAPSSNAELNFQATIDMSNLNDTYRSEISLTEQYFSNRGLKISPVRVVSKETMERAYRVAGEKPIDGVVDEQGRSVHDRAIVIDDQNQDIIEQFGRSDYILGVALHEAAHSLHKHSTILRVQEQGNRVSPKYFEVGGWGKANLRGNNIVGDFLEEGFADLTRVRALRELGRSNDISTNTRQFGFGDKVFIAKPNDNSESPYDSSVTVLPAEFAMMSRDLEDRGQIVTSGSNFAAYALDLLDSRAPGLYADLVASTQDPKRQADAIRKIESVQPGLYQALRPLGYNDKDFAKGLSLVQEALVTHRKSVNPAQIQLTRAAMRNIEISIE